MTSPSRWDEGEGEFWDVNSSDTEAKKRATAHMAFMLDRTLKDELVTHRDIIDGIFVHRITALLPRTERKKIIAAALSTGQKKKPFSEAGTRHPPSMRASR